MQRSRSDKKKLFHQLMRFGIIGLSTAAIHFSIVVFLVETFRLNPLIANVFAFITVFQISYWGNRTWTFAGTTTKHSVAFPRLFMLYSANFLANESLFYVFLVIFKLPYPLALFLVLSILPIITFTVSRRWIFS